MQSSLARILGIVATVVRTVAAVIAAVILVYAVFVLFGANPNNGLVSFTSSVYDDFGGFTKDLFHTSSNPKYGVAINVGLAAVIWIVAGSVISKLIVRFAPSSTTKTKA
jgi:hypothetical protein